MDDLSRLEGSDEDINTIVTPTAPAADPEVIAAVVEDCNVGCVPAMKTATRFGGSRGSGILSPSEQPPKWPSCSWYSDSVL